MPFILVISGLVMIISGLRNTHVQLGGQLRKDFVPFGSWVLAMGAVGALGYVPELRRFSHYFMALIIVAMLLSNKGFFAKLSEAVKMGPVSPTPPATAPSALTAPPATSPSTGGKPAGAGLDNTGAFGQAPETAGQAKFNTYLNYLLKLLPFM